MSGSAPPRAASKGPRFLPGTRLQKGPVPSPGPLLYRATITIDFEATADGEAEEEKAAIKAVVAAIKPEHETMRLVFRRRRKPGARPRPGAPGPMVAAYADD